LGERAGSSGRGVRLCTLESGLLFPLAPVEQAADHLVMHVHRLIGKVLRCANQECNQQSMALFFAEAVQVLNGVPGTLARQLLQTALMHGGADCIVQPDNPNCRQFLA